MKRIMVLMTMVLCVFAAHAANYGEVAGGQEWSGAIGTACLVAAGIGLVAFCLAYPKVKRGELVVYASWSDFGMSLLWIPIAVCGLVQACGADLMESGVGMTLAIIFTILGSVSAFWLVWGAFKYNRGAYACIVSLGARMFVTFLFMFAMSKLTEGKKSFSGAGDNAAAVKAALIAFAISGFIFAKLIKPMIGTRTVR